jgi:hypothetical protein
MSDLLSYSTAGSDGSLSGSTDYTTDADARVHLQHLVPHKVSASSAFQVSGTLLVDLVQLDVPGCDVIKSLVAFTEASPAISMQLKCY